MASPVDSAPSCLGGAAFGGVYANGERVLGYRSGDSLFPKCQGGTSRGRLETFPPRLEIPERGGIYVLVDDGPAEAWSYQFVGTFDG